MYHLDIPKTRQYDTGKIEVIARSSVGETLATADLKVVPRSDDYRNVLKNSPRRKYYCSSTKKTLHGIWRSLVTFDNLKHLNEFA